MNLKKRGFYLVAAFLLLIGWMFWNEAKADVFVESGPSFLSAAPSDGFLLMAYDKTPEGWMRGIGYQSTQVCDCSNGRIPIRENAFVFAGREVKKGRFIMDLGASFWQETSRVSSGKLNFTLAVGWEFNDRWAIKFRHWSNAGTGRDGKNCQTCGFNLGQDSINVAFRVGGN